MRYVEYCSGLRPGEKVGNGYHGANLRFTMSDLNEMETFVAVVEAKGFRAAGASILGWLLRPVEERHIDARGRDHRLEVAAVSRDQPQPMHARSRCDEDIPERCPSPRSKLGPDCGRPIRHRSIDRQDDALRGEQLELSKLYFEWLAKAERRAVAAEPLKYAHGADC